MEAACRDNEWSPEELKRECAANRAQLWFAATHETTDAALVTRIEKGVCFLCALGGRNIEGWLGLLDELETWAKAQGCNIIRFIGRRGWARKLHDYRETRIVMEKRL